MIHDIKSYNPIATDKFLVDTNIWLFLHCPIGNHKSHIVSKYSSFFKKLVLAKSQILISSSIVSEFLNRYIRIDFEIQRLSDRSITDYKNTYRKSSYYRKTSTEAAKALENKILPSSMRINDEFDLISIKNFLINLNLVDVNDSYMLELISNKGIKVLTDDSDFELFKSKCEIYTSNPKLLLQI